MIFALLLLFIIMYFMYKYTSHEDDVYINELYRNKNTNEVVYVTKLNNLYVTFEDKAGKEYSMTKEEFDSNYGYE